MRMRAARGLAPLVNGQRAAATTVCGCSSTRRVLSTQSYAQTSVAPSQLLRPAQLPLPAESLRPLLERHGATAGEVEWAGESVRGRYELAANLDAASLASAAADSAISAAVADAAKLRLKLSFLSTLNNAERAEFSATVSEGAALLAVADEVHKLAQAGEPVGPTIEAHVRIPVDRIAQFDAAEFSKRVEAAMPWAQRSEVLLTLGCDDRTTIDPDEFAPRKVNKYFTSTVPDPLSTQRSSCTSSSTSPLSYSAADAHREGLLHDAIIGARTSDEIMDGELEAMRARLLKSLSLTPGTEVILTPSGSDAEMLPTILVRPRGKGTCCFVFLFKHDAALL